MLKLPKLINQNCMRISLGPMVFDGNIVWEDETGEFPNRAIFKISRTNIMSYHNNTKTPINDRYFEMLISGGYNFTDFNSCYKYGIFIDEPQINYEYPGYVFMHLQNTIGKVVDQDTFISIKDFKWFEHGETAFEFALEYHSFLSDIYLIFNNKTSLFDISIKEFVQDKTILGIRGNIPQTGAQIQLPITVITDSKKKNLWNLSLINHSPLLLKEVRLSA